MKSIFPILMITFIFSSPLMFATNFVACSSVGTGIHTLSVDISNRNGNCFTTTASNIIFDCQGHKIDGDNDAVGFGFESNSNNNVTIKNCIFTEFQVGVIYVASSNGQIFNITASNNTHSGIYLQTNSNYNIVKNITADENTENGVAFSSGSSYNLLTNSSFYGNYKGFHSQTDANHNTMSNIIAFGNFFGSSSSSNYNSISNVNLSNNVALGILVGNASNSNYTNIDISFNGNTGIWLQEDSNSNIFSNINIKNNTNYGIVLANGSNNIFNQLDISFNHDVGIYFDSGSNSNTIKLSIVKNNENYDIYIDNSSNNLFYGNYFSNESMLFNSNWALYKTFFNNSIIGNFYDNFNNSLCTYNLESDNSCQMKICNNDNYIINNPNAIDYLPIGGSKGTSCILETNLNLFSSSNQNTQSNIFPFNNFFSSFLSLITILIILS